MAARRLKRGLRAVSIGLLVVLVLDQVLLHGPLADGRFAGAPIAPFFPWAFEEVGGEEAPLIAHPRLGWIAERRESGARESGTRVLLYGGSIAYGLGVAPEDSFAALVDGRLATLRIENLAVPYHSPDQTWLAREELPRLPTDELWFALEPATARCAMTGYVPLARRDMRVPRFKPRLVPRGPSGFDVVAPAPPETATDRDAWCEFVRGEELCGSAYDVPGIGERSGLVRLLATWKLARELDLGAGLSKPSHPNYRLVRDLVLDLQDRSSREGLRFRLLVLPHRSDLEDPSWRVLVDELSSHGIEVLDLFGTLGVQGGSGNPALWTESGTWAEGAHAKAAEHLALYLSQAP